MVEFVAREVFLTQKVIGFVLELEVAADVKVLQVTPDSHGFIQRSISIKGEKVLETQAPIMIGVVLAINGMYFVVVAFGVRSQTHACKPIVVFFAHLVGPRGVLIVDDSEYADGFGVELVVDDDVLFGNGGGEFAGDRQGVVGGDVKLGEGVRVEVVRELPFAHHSQLLQAQAHLGGDEFLELQQGDVGVLEEVVLADGVAGVRDVVDNCDVDERRFAGLYHRGSLQFLGLLRVIYHHLNHVQCALYFSQVSLLVDCF